MADDHAEDIRQIVEAVGDELEGRLDADLSAPDWCAVVTAVTKAAARGFTLGAAVSEQRIRGVLDEVEQRLRDAGINLPGGLLLPVGILDSDETPFAEPDVWAEQYGSE